PKIYFHIDGHRDWLAIEHGRLKLPGFYGLNGFLIQPHAQTFLYADVPGPPIRADDQPQCHCSLQLHGSSGVRISRLRIVNDVWRRHPVAPRRIQSLLPVTKSSAFASSVASATTVADSTPRTRTIRQRPAYSRQRMPNGPVWGGTASAAISSVGAIGSTGFSFITAADGGANCSSGVKRGSAPVDGGNRSWQPPLPPPVPEKTIGNSACHARVAAI